MKKDKETDKDELRPEYKLSDFPDGMVRGKYSKRLMQSTNVIVLRPEVAEVFPNEDAVNNALLSLIDIAHRTTRLTRRSAGWHKKRTSQ